MFVFPFFLPEVAGDIELGAFSPARPGRARTRPYPGARSGGPHTGRGGEHAGLLDGRTRDYNIPFVESTFPASRSSSIVA